MKNFINAIKQFHNKKEYESKLLNIFLAPFSAISELRSWSKLFVCNENFSSIVAGYILHIPDSYTLVSSTQVCRIWCRDHCQQSLERFRQCGSQFYHWSPGKDGYKVFWNKFRKIWLLSGTVTNCFKPHFPGNEMKEYLAKAWRFILKPIQLFYLKINVFDILDILVKLSTLY